MTRLEPEYHFKVLSEPSPEGLGSVIHALMNIKCPIFSVGAQGLPSVAHKSSQQQVPSFHSPKWFQDDHWASQRHQGQPTENLPEANWWFYQLFHQGLSPTQSPSHLIYFGIENLPPLISVIFYFSSVLFYIWMILSFEEQSYFQLNPLLASHSIPQITSFRSLLLSLCLFHGIALERRKFGSLGFNIPYEFTDGDLNICISQLKMFLDEYQNVPYKVRDRRLVSMFNYLFSIFALKPPFSILCVTVFFFIIMDG